MSIWKPGKQKFAEHLLENIKTTSSINDKGKLQYDGGFEISPFDLLSECIKINCSTKSSPDVNLEKLVFDVIENLIKNNRIIEESIFIKEFNRVIKKKPEYVKTSPYQVVIEALIQTPSNQKLSINDCDIQVITKKFSKKIFLKDFSDFQAKSIIVVNCNSYSSDRAQVKAMDSIELIRAVWHLSDQSRWKIETQESLIKPHNPIALGNYCYILQQDADVIWKKQRVNFIKNPESQSMLKIEASTIKKGSKILNLLTLIRESNLEYYNLLTNSMIQYIKALDSMDLTNSLPLIWGAIETIIKKNNENKYDVFINRCAFLYSDHFYVKNLLELIKEHRNNFVHNGTENIRLTKLFLIELEKIYKSLFLFHINHASNQRSFEDAIELLSLPVEMTALKNKKKIIEQAIVFHSKTKAVKSGN